MAVLNKSLSLVEKKVTFINWHSSHSFYGANQVNLTQRAKERRKTKNTCRRSKMQLDRISI